MMEPRKDDFFLSADLFGSLNSSQNLLVAPQFFAQAGRRRVKPKQQPSLPLGSNGLGLTMVAGSSWGESFARMTGIRYLKYNKL
jgi:hypothetical protein